MDLKDFELTRAENPEIWKTLEYINDSYGSGEIVKVYEVTRAPPTGVVVTSIPISGRVTTKQTYGTRDSGFSLDRDKLTYRGQTRKLKTAN